jgi:hypothetical protein
MNDHITRYDKMPIPPVEVQTEYFEAGNVRIGVEYRVVTEAVAAANRAALDNATGDVVGKLEELDDCGVSLHVYGRADNDWLEYLRFDCFQEEPHYHYVSWSTHENEVLHIDPVADGDPVAWALERVRTRLPQMFARAKAPQVAAMVDLNAIEAVMGRITEAAYRARFHSNKAEIQKLAEQKRPSLG